MTKIGFLLLSGGRSKRMGSPKALIELGGRTLLDTVAQAGEGFAQCILSANDPCIPTPEGFVRCADEYPGCGPMAGIHAALRKTCCDALVTAPCDAPYYCAELAQYLCTQYEPGLDAVVLVDHTGREQPLCGVYSKRCLPILEEHLAKGHFKMGWMLEQMDTKKVSLPQSLSEQVFENLNTQQELEQFRARQAQPGMGASGADCTKK